MTVCMSILPTFSTTDCITGKYAPMGDFVQMGEWNPIPFVFAGTLKPITIGFNNLAGGERPLDIKTIQEFKKLSPADKIIFIHDRAAGNQAIKLLAMWLADLERKTEK